MAHKIYIGTNIRPDLLAPTDLVKYDFTDYYDPTLKLLTIVDPYGGQRGSVTFSLVAPPDTITLPGPITWNFASQIADGSKVWVFDRPADNPAAIMRYGGVITENPKSTVGAVNKDGTLVYRYDVNVGDNTNKLRHKLVSQEFKQKYSGFVLRTVLGEPYVYNMDISSLTTTTGTLLADYKAKTVYPEQVIDEITKFEGWSYYISWDDKFIMSDILGSLNTLILAPFEINESNYRDIIDHPNSIFQSYEQIKNRIRFYYKTYYIAGLVNVTQGAIYIIGAKRDGTNATITDGNGDLATEPNWENLVAGCTFRIGTSRVVYNIVAIYHNYNAALNPGGPGAGFNGYEVAILNAPYQDPTAVNLVYRCDEIPAKTSRDNPDSQTAVAALFGDDGIREYILPSDENYRTRKEAGDKCEAEIQAFADPQIVTTLVSDNYRISGDVRSGMSVRFDLPTRGIVNTYLIIKQVTFTDTGAALPNGQQLYTMQIEFKNRLSELISYLIFVDQQLRQVFEPDNSIIQDIFSLNDQSFAEDIFDESMIYLTSSAVEAWYEDTTDPTKDSFYDQNIYQNASSIYDDPDPTSGFYDTMVYEP